MEVVTGLQALEDCRARECVMREITTARKCEVHAGALEVEERQRAANSPKV